jgi:photosynthetic reaction center cytochrome c subunit
LDDLDWLTFAAERAELLVLDENPVMRTPPVQLYFDEESGLLVRVLCYAETPLGRNPTQIDYADYRGEGDVKALFRWTVATIQIEKMQPNVPIEGDKFAKPGQ